MSWATTGEYTDAETGFQYLRARYYDPATGQFLNRDPLEAQTREPYGYVHGNPLNATDPSGLDSYSYTYNLGTKGTPEQLLQFTIANCSPAFPIRGCFDDFQVGEKMNLRRVSWFPYVQGFPVRVTGITSTSFSFVSLKGHPEGVGRKIDFSFYCDDGMNKLRVSTSSNGSASVNWFGLKQASFWLARTTWSSLASNIRSDFE